MTDLPTDAAGLYASLADAWAAKDLERIMAHFTDDAVYHNIPMEPAEGTDAIRATIEGFLGMAESIRFDTLHQVVDGDVLMNERVDTFLNGDTEIAIKVMGVFQIRDGRIAAWRDYFDMTGLTGG